MESLKIESTSEKSLYLIDEEIDILNKSIQHFQEELETMTNSFNSKINTVYDFETIELKLKLEELEDQLYILFNELDEKVNIKNNILKNIPLEQVIEEKKILIENIILDSNKIEIKNI